MNTPKHHRLIIIGSGPAGCTAAIYAARANLEPAVIAGLQQGGQLIQTSSIENWPGEEQITGAALMEKMIAQMQRFDTKIVSDNINQVNLADRPFHLKGDSEEYTCDALIIATGASPNQLGIASEQKYLGRGVSSCAVCDGFFYKNKKIVIVGGGNTMAEDALYLAKLASEVIIIHRREKFRADPLSIERLKKLTNVKFECSSTVEEILGDDGGVTGIKIKNCSSDEIKEIETAGVFIAIGYKPNTALFTDQLETNEGYIKTGLDKTATATSIKGVFAAGDVISPKYHQAVAAAGSGCMAALDAKDFLDSLV